MIVKPNRDEARAASLRVFGEVDYFSLRAHMQAPCLIITHGPDGALVVQRRGLAWARERAIDNPVDICGAGDSFSAAAALALKVTGDPVLAARFGNLAAAVTIMKKGTGAATPAEILARAAGGF